jgi:hypothetical protein
MSALEKHPDVFVRTTLTLEDGLAKKVADIARESRRPFKVVVNEVLRRGLAEPAAEEPEFRIEPHAGQLLPGIDDRGFNELAWELDRDL